MATFPNLNPEVYSSGHQDKNYFHENNEVSLIFEGPLYFFVTHEWAFLLCVKREGRFIISVIRESIFFRPQETGFRCFLDPRNMHLLSRDF